MCKYGYKQGVMVWVNTDDWSELLKVAKFLDAKISLEGFDRMQAFIIYMNPNQLNTNEVNNKLGEFAKKAGLNMRYAGAQFDVVALAQYSSPILTMEGSGIITR